jgi:hypothetical protein
MCTVQQERIIIGQSGRRDRVRERKEEKQREKEKEIQKDALRN